MIAPGIRVVRGPDWIWQNQGESTRISSVLQRTGTGILSQLLSGQMVVNGHSPTAPCRNEIQQTFEMEFSEEFSIKLGHD